MLPKCSHVVKDPLNSDESARQTDQEKEFGGILLKRKNEDEELAASSSHSHREQSVQFLLRWA